MNITPKQKRSLRMYKEKHKMWREFFNLDHKNSITSQLYNLIWQTAVFRIINGARFISRQSDGATNLNGLIHRFIDNCFFEYQFISLRRLLDKDSGKTTFSLYTLVKDMEDNCHLITRLNYLTSSDLEYDVEKVRVQCEEFELDQIRRGSISYILPHNLNWEFIEEKHVDFDFLSHTNNNSRKPTDSVQKVFFTKLRNKLDSLNEIVNYTHKFVAHLERPDVSVESDIDNFNITLGKIWNAHEVICKVATLINRLFFEGGGGFLAIAQYAKFKNIEKPFVKFDDIPKLAKIWDEYQAETDSWGNFGINDYDFFIKPASIDIKDNK